MKKEELKLFSKDGRLHEFEIIDDDSIRIFGKDIIVEYIRYFENDSIKELKLKGAKSFKIGDEIDENYVICSIIEDKQSDKPNSFIIKRKKYN
jgi:hypothetical protein